MQYEMNNGEIFFDSDLHTKLNEIFFFRTADFIEESIINNKKVEEEGIDLNKLVKEGSLNNADIFEYLASHVDQNDEKSDVIEVLEEAITELSKFKKYSNLVGRLERAYDIVSDNMMY